MRRQRIAVQQHSQQQVRQFVGLTKQHEYLLNCQVNVFSTTLCRRRPATALAARQDVARFPQFS